MIRRTMRSSARAATAAGFLLFLCSPAATQFGNEWAAFTEDPSRLAAGTISSLANEVDFAWGDLDLDGWADLVVARKQPWSTPGKRTNILLMNDHGVLVDSTGQYASASDFPGDSGFLTPTNDRDVVISDLDLDGWPDVVTATTISTGEPKHIGHPRIYMNLGEDAAGEWLGLRYEEARFPQLHVFGSGAPVNPVFCAVAAGDVTGDGYPDLYFADYDSSATSTFIENPFDDLDDRLLINDGTGFFTDESQLRMTATMLESNFGTEAAIVDVNGDGFHDVLKDTALGPYHISVSYNDPANEGSFNIFDKIHTSLNPYDFDVGDLNKDGRLDLVISLDFKDRYRYNLGNDPLGRVIWGPAKVFQFLEGADDGFAGNNLVADLDGDGWNDAIYCDVDPDIPGVDRRVHVYHNPGGVVGAEIDLLEEREKSGPGGWLGAKGLYESDLEGGYDVAVFDIDHDGANDMVLGRGEGTFVWMNEASPVFCQQDLGYGGPGTATLSVCGPALESGKSAMLLLENAAPLAPAILAVGFRFDPTPFAGGTIVPVPPYQTFALTTDAAGRVSLTVPGGLGPSEAYAQMGVVDATQPGGYQISNAILVEQLP